MSKINPEERSTRFNALSHKEPLLGGHHALERKGWAAQGTSIRDRLQTRKRRAKTRAIMLQVDQGGKVQLVCLVILAAVGMSFALYFLEPVLVPLVLAMFISQAMQPLLFFLTKRTRLPSSLAIFLGMLCLCGFFVGVIFATIFRCASNLVHSLPACSLEWQKREKSATLG